MVKDLPAMQETRVGFLGQEDPLKKEMATHSSILAGKFRGQRILSGHTPWGRKRVGHDRMTEHACAVRFSLVGMLNRGDTNSCDSPHVNRNTSLKYELLEKIRDKKGLKHIMFSLCKKVSWRF